MQKTNSTWSGNLWAFAIGAFFCWASWAHGQLHFAQAIHHFFFQHLSRVPTYVTALVVSLYWTLGILGLLIIIGYVVFSALRRSILSFLLGSIWINSTGRERAVLLLLLLALGDGLLFLGVRVMRDIVRWGEFADLPFEQRRASLVQYDPLAPTYEAIQRFKQDAPDEPLSIGIVRPPLPKRIPAIRDDYLVLSYELFPFKVYVLEADPCEDSEEQRRALAGTQVSLVIVDCGEPFVPNFQPSSLLRGKS